MQHSYIQLAKHLKSDIRAQRYRPGDKLPSVRLYAAAQGVSVSTVIRCYRHLESEGYVQVRAKSGMYVADWKALQQARRATASLTIASPPAVHYEQLTSLQHRMTQLYVLTSQPLALGLHLANAAPQWYPCETLARIGQRLLRGNPTALGTYPAGTGLPALKTALIGPLANCGIDILPHELLITGGATEALQIALRAVTKPGDAVIVESPAYFGILQMIENLGLKALEIPCVAEQGISLEALEYALEHHSGIRAMVVTPSFQNPLGSSMSDAAKRRMLGIAERHDIALIEDDVFGDLAGGLERPRPVKAWDRTGRVIYCGSASKSMAPAMRLGWVIGGRHQRQLESLKLSNSLATPLFEQAVLAEFMKSGALPSHLRKLRERLAATVQPAAHTVLQHFPKGTRIEGPAAGWWLWIALPEPFDTLGLLPTAVRHGIAFTPGVLFSVSGKYANCLRLNIARPWGLDLEQGLKTLGKLIAAQQGETVQRTRPDAESSTRVQGR